MRPSPRPADPLLPPPPAVLERLDALVALPGAAADALARQLQADPRLCGELLALDASAPSLRELVERLGPRGLRPRCVQAGLLARLDDPARRARAVLTGRLCALLERHARARVELPATELGALGAVHELGRELSEAPAARTAARPQPHAWLAARVARSWGLSGALIQALAAHHGGDEQLARRPGAALLALAESAADAVCQRRLDAAEEALTPSLASLLGLRRAEMARLVDLASAELAAIAA